MSQDPNVSTLELAAAALGPLLDELVLVGGCAVGLLITDPARPPVRHTIDVDLVTEVTPRADYYAFCDRLKKQGFSERLSEEVMCRWANGYLLIDVMPTDDAVLGFTNSWYAAAVRSATRHSLPSGREIRLVSAPVFLATKLEAFHSRGGGDYLHHDIEDIISVIDGREGIVGEVQQSEARVKSFLMEEFDDLLSDNTFLDRIGGHIAQEGEDRKDFVVERMRKIAGL